MKTRLFILFLILLTALFGVALADEIELQDGVIDLRSRSAQVVEEQGTLTLEAEDPLNVGDRVWLGDAAYRVTGRSSDSVMVEELPPTEYLESISVHQDGLTILYGEGTSSEIVTESGVEVTVNSVYVSQSNAFTVNMSIGAVDITVPLNLDGKMGLDFDYNFLEQELKELRYTSDITVHGTVKVEAALNGSPDGFSVPVGNVTFYTNGIVTVGADMWLNVSLSGEGLINYSASVYANVTYNPITGETEYDSDSKNDVSFEMHGAASLGTTITPYLRLLGLGEILSLPIDMSVNGTLDTFIDEKYQCSDLEAWFDLTVDASIGIFDVRFNFRLLSIKQDILKHHYELNGAGQWKKVEKCIRDLIPEEEKVYCTLTFDTDGGSPIAPMIVEKGMPIADIPTPTKAGYVFGYWYGGDPASSFSPHDGIHKDLTVVAIWIPADNPEEPQEIEKPGASSGTTNSAVFYLNDGFSDDEVIDCTYYSSFYSLNNSTIKDPGDGVVVLPASRQPITGYFRIATPSAWDEETLMPIAFSFSTVTQQVTLSIINLPHVPIVVNDREEELPTLDVGSAHTVIVPSGFNESYRVYGANLQTVIVEGGAVINTRYMFTGNPNLKTVILESGASVTSNAYEAFARIPNLETVYLEDGVSVAAYSLFCCNPSLTTVRLPQDWITTPVEIFYDCPALTSIDLPDSLTSIGLNSFLRTGLESVVIPKNVIVIGQGAFSDCEDLRKVEFNDKLEAIDNGAFYSTALLEIDLPDSLTYLGDSVFGWCHCLTEVDMPDSITRVGVDLFSCCENLEYVKLPRNLGLVQSGMFMGCSKLKEIVWPEPTLILGEYAFYRSGFEQLDVPDTVLKIYPYALYGMKHLTSLGLPPSVIEIGDHVFGDYPLLKELVLPEGMTTIEYPWGTAINYCHSLRRLVLPSTFEYPDYFWNHPYDLDYYTFDLVMSDGPTSIGSNAFVGENLLFRELELPDTLQFIDNYSFCEMPLLCEITLPASLAEIGVGVFCSNPSLNKVTILNRDLYPSGCFEDCAEDLVIRGYRYSSAEWFARDYGFEFEPIEDDQVELRWTTDGRTFQSRLVTADEPLTGMVDPTHPAKVFIGWFTDAACTTPWNFASDLVPWEGLTLWAGWMDSGHADFMFRLEDDDTLTVIQCLSNAAAVEIPAQVGTRQVCGVAAGAFDGKPTQTLTVPASVTLEPSALLGAASLQSVTFAQGSRYTFSNGLIIDTADNALFFAPEACRQATMTLPEGVEGIRTAAFWGDNAPSVLHLPTTLTTIEPFVFQSNGAELYSSVHLDAVSASAAEYGLRYNLYPVTYIRDGQTWLTGEAQAYLPLTTALLPYEYGVRYAWHTDAAGAQPWAYGTVMPAAPLTLYACPSPVFATQENADGSLTITAYLAQDAQVVIPDELDGKPVTGIGAGAFPAAVEITLSAGVTDIAQGAFASGCVIIADQGSAAQRHAANNGLTYQERLYELSFVTNSAHMDALRLAKGAQLPLGEVERYGYTFAGWYTDKALSQAAPATMPASRLTLYAAWVESNEPLDYELRIAPDGGVKLLRYLGSESDLSVPGTLGGRAVTCIGEYAFADSGVTSLELPASVTEVEDLAFADCANLQVAVLGSGVTSFPPNLFSGCGRLEAVLIRAENASVRNNLFYNAPNIFAPVNSQTLSDLYNSNNSSGVITPEGRAFSMFVDSWVCVVDEPRQMHFVQYWPVGGGGDVIDWQFDPADKGENLGDNRFVARELGQHVVYGTVDGLTFSMSSVGCYRQDEQLFTSYQDEPTELVLYDADVTFNADLLEVPASVQGMPVTGVDAYAIYNRSNLRTVILPDTITHLDDYAFAYSYDLHSILIPSSVTAFGNYVLYGSSNATVYCYEGSAAHTYAQDNGLDFILISEQPYTYEVAEDGVILTGFNGFALDVEIPAEVDGYPVVGLGDAFRNNQFIRHVTLPEGMRFIADEAFYGSSLSSFTIPSTLETIGADAFANCANLRSVTVPSTVQTLGDRAFSICSNLTQASIGARNIGSDIFRDCFEPVDLTLLPGVEVIGDQAFYFMSLTSLTLPEGVKTIGESAFANNMLTDITLPDSLTEIGDSAFSYNQLESIVLPDSLTVLGDYAFSGNSLTEVTLPDGLTEIGAWAFSYNQLESIVIPASVVTVGDSAFSGNSLTDVTLCDGLTAIGANAFYSNELQSIVLPDSLTTLGEYAFANNDDLSAVTFSSNLTDIAAYTFYNCSLESIELPASLTAIGDYAFYQNGLTTLDIPVGVVSIGENAFGYCQNLTQLTVPSTVQTIGSYAFFGCTGLTRADIQAKEIDDYAFVDCSSLTDLTLLRVRSIGSYAFSDCGMTTLELCLGVNSIGYNAFYSDALQEVILPSTAPDFDNYIFDDPLVYVVKGSDAESYCTRHGYSYEYYTPEYELSLDSADEVCIDGYNGTQTAPVIPAEMDGYPVTAIGSYVFSSKGLTGITLPGTVRRIGDGAFEHNELLSCIELPDGLTSLGASAFSGCSALTSITLPDGLTSIGAYTFYDCSALTSITLPGSLTSIGRYAFYDCSALTSITLPDGLASMGEYAFANTGLTALTIPGSVKTVSSELLNYTPVTRIVLQEGVERIDEQAFSGLDYLNSVTIPDTVTEIGSYAFQACPQLEHVALPGNLTALSDGLFASCSALKSITLPQTVTSVGNSTFASTALIDMELPEGIVSIGDYAFRYSDLRSITLPESLTTVGAEAFYGTNLTEVELPDDLTDVAYDAFPYDCAIICEPGTSAYEYAVANDFAILNRYNGQTTPFTLEISGDSCRVTGFTGLNISTIEIPAEICGCKVSAVTALEVREPEDVSKIIIQEGVTELSAGVFAHLPYLHTLYLPDSLEIIGDGIVSDFSNLSICASPDSAAHAYATANGAEFNPINRVATEDELSWTVNDDGVSVTLTYYRGYARHVILPDTVDGCLVTALDGTFEYKNNLVSVVMPDTVVTIGDNTFYNCTNLTSVQLSQNVTAIGDNAFYNCSSLESIALPDRLVSLGGSAFSYCSGLTSVSLPQGVTILADYVFHDCTALESVSLPQGLTAIDDYAFYGCSSLDGVALPDSLVTIGRYAFYDCSGLTSIRLPQGVTVIESNTFYNCSSLKKVTFPAGLKSIGSYAFDCTRLIRICLPTQLETVAAGAFPSSAKLVALPGTPTAAALESIGFVEPTRLKLPAGTVAVDAEAFVGARAEMVVIPEGCTVIGDKAFADMPNLHYVSLPASVESIADSAFSGCPAPEIITP